MTATPDGPVMVQVGGHELLVWRWDGSAWRPEEPVLPREDGYVQGNGYPSGHAFAYFDEEARVPVAGYLDRSGTASSQPLDGSDPVVIPGTGIFGELTAVFDPSTRRPMLHGSHRTVLLDGGKIASAVGGPTFSSLGTLAADPAGSRVIAVDFDRTTHEWTGDAWRELPSPLAESYTGISTLAYCPFRRRVVCAVADDETGTMDLKVLEGDRWVGGLRVSAVRAGALLAAGPGDRALVMFGGSDSSGLMVAETWYSDGGEFRRVAAPLELPSAGMVSPVVLDGRLAVVHRRDLSVRFLEAGRWGGWARPASPDVSTMLGLDTNFATDGSDLWLLDGMGVLWCSSGDEGFRRLAEGGPGPRPSDQAAMTYDQVHDRLVLVGGDRRIEGVRAASRRNDTWAFTDGAWRRLETRGTPPEGPGAAAGTPAGVYLFVNDELWRLEGSRWTCVARGPERLSGDRALWYEPHRGVLLAAAEDAVWTVVGDRIVHVADLPAGSVAALDPSADRLVTVTSGQQNFELPLDDLDLAEASLPARSIEPRIRREERPVTRPLLVPPIDSREWTELRRGQEEQSLRYLGPEYAGRLVRSEVRLSHGPGTGGRTRMGGAPLLDQGAQWPTRDGRPLSLLALIDCAEVTALGAVDLPRTGYLNFFYDFLNFRDEVVNAEPGFDGFDGLAPTRTDGWRVIHSGSAATETETPDEALLFLERTMTCSHTAFTIGYAADAGYFSADYPDEEPEGPVLELPARTSSRLYALGDAWEALPPVGDRPDGEPRHKIGGFPDWIQGPMWHHIQMSSNGIPLDGDEPDPREAALLPSTPEWRLLLQLDTDDELGWLWGDGGRLYFAIRVGDLAKGDFSRTWLAADCY
ncbi:DUF1963 domain-containing protein [Spirillospora sp. CA-142024]|uniref:DUF1963 domain-containing protein n=1 Tax=Spirillospora sp. CA-142024 TaxID=3240036 RepID=UPI003D91F6FC